MPGQPLGAQRGEPGGGRGLGAGRAARRKAPAHRPAPGRLGERAEATAVDLPGGCRPEAQRDRRVWGCLEPWTPTSPPHPVDGPARGAGPGPAEAPQLFRDTGPQQRRVGGGGAVGERAFGRQRLRLGAVGVGRRLQGLCKNTCVSREWVFGEFGFRSQHLPVPLCVRGLARLSYAGIYPRSAAWRLVVGTGGRSACVRIRGLCLSTCLGWVSVGHVCALRA